MFAEHVLQSTGGHIHRIGDVDHRDVARDVVFDERDRPPHEHRRAVRPVDRGGLQPSGTGERRQDAGSKVPVRVPHDQRALRRDRTGQHSMLDMPDRPDQVSTGHR